MNLFICWSESNGSFVSSFIGLLEILDTRIMTILLTVSQIVSAHNFMIMNPYDLGIRP